MAESPKLPTPELVAALRRCADHITPCQGCPFYKPAEFGLSCMDSLMLRAARRLEELTTKEVAD